MRRDCKRRCLVVVNFPGIYPANGRLLLLSTREPGLVFVENASCDLLHGGGCDDRPRIGRGAFHALLTLDAMKSGANGVEHVPNEHHGGLGAVVEGGEIALEDMGAGLFGRGVNGEATLLRFRCKLTGKRRDRLDRCADDRRETKRNSRCLSGAGAGSRITRTPRALAALAAGFAPLALWELFSLCYYGFLL